MSNELRRKDINDLHIELWHPLEEITQALRMTMSLQLTDILEPCKACTLEKAKEARVSKTVAVCSTAKGKRLFIHISSAYCQCG